MFAIKKSAFHASKSLSRSMSLIKHQAYINGAWTDSVTKNKFPVTNPATGETIASVPDMTVDDAQAAIDAASAAFPAWSARPAKERSALLHAWFALLADHRAELAAIVSAETGKPLAEAAGEVDYGNSFVEYFAGEARAVLGEIVPGPAAGRKLLVERQPIGAVGLITPWNFPHAMVARKAGAALAAGCTCVVRPAEDTPLAALALAELAHRAGLPRGALNVVTSARAQAPAIGRLLCESEQVAGVSFTGSTQVGKALYAQCAGGVKRLGLELGGNAPFIVYASADLEAAARGAVAAKFRNCGQTCVAANRFLVEGAVHDRFVEMVVAAVRDLKVGCGTVEGVQVGPLINEAQLAKVSGLVEDAVRQCATCLVGGEALPAAGALFYAPTVLTGVHAGMRLYHEEVFGPVVSVVRFADEAESVRVANGTRSGLAGYFYSEDVAQIFRVARALEVGMVGVNEGLISTAEAPFGGIKESGLGREGSRHALDEYLYMKYVCIGNLA